MQAGSIQLISFNTEFSEWFLLFAIIIDELEGTLWGTCPNLLLKSGSTLKSEQVAQGYAVTSWTPPRTEIPQPFWTAVPILHYLHSIIFLPWTSPDSVNDCCLFSHQASEYRRWLCLLSYFLAGTEKSPLKVPPFLLLLFRGRHTSVSLLCETFSLSFFHANLH